MQVTRSGRKSLPRSSDFSGTTLHVKHPGSRACANTNLRPEVADHQSVTVSRETDPPDSAACSTDASSRMRAPSVPRPYHRHHEVAPPSDGAALAAHNHVERSQYETSKAIPSCSTLRGRLGGPSRLNATAERLRWLWMFPVEPSCGDTPHPETSARSVDTTTRPRPTSRGATTLARVGATLTICGVTRSGGHTDPVVHTLVHIGG